MRRSLTKILYSISDRPNAGSNLLEECVFEKDIGTQLGLRGGVLASSDINQEGRYYGEKGGGDSDNLVLLRSYETVSDERNPSEKGGIVFIIGLLLGIVSLLWGWRSSGNGWR